MSSWSTSFHPATPTSPSTAEGGNRLTLMTSVPLFWRPLCLTPPSSSLRRQTTETRAIISTSIIPIRCCGRLFSGWDRGGGAQHPPPVAPGPPPPSPPSTSGVVRAGKVCRLPSAPWSVSCLKWVVPDPNRPLISRKRNRQLWEIVPRAATIPILPWATAHHRRIPARGINSPPTRSLPSPFWTWPPTATLIIPTPTKLPRPTYWLCHKRTSGLSPSPRHATLSKTRLTSWILKLWSTSNVSNTSSNSRPIISCMFSALYVQLLCTVMYNIMYVSHTLHWGHSVLNHNNKLIIDCINFVFYRPKKKKRKKKRENKVIWNHTCTC